MFNTVILIYTNIRTNKKPRLRDYKYMYTLFLLNPSPSPSQSKFECTPLSVVMRVLRVRRLKYILTAKCVNGLPALYPLQSFSRVSVN